MEGDFNNFDIREAMEKFLEEVPGFEEMMNSKDIPFFKGMPGFGTVDLGQAIDSSIGEYSHCKYSEEVKEIMDRIIKLGGKCGICAVENRCLPKLLMQTVLIFKLWFVVAEAIDKGKQLMLFIDANYPNFFPSDKEGGMGKCPGS